MRMSEVAERAGVSIGSLYQYLSRQGRDHPHAGRALQRARPRLHRRRRWPSVGDMAGLQKAFAGLVDIYYGMFLAEPVMRDIWSGTQADKALRDIDLADSRPVRATAGRRAERLRPEADPEALSSLGVPHHGSSAKRRCGWRSRSTRSRGRRAGRRPTSGWRCKRDLRRLRQCAKTKTPREAGLSACSTSSETYMARPS